MSLSEFCVVGSGAAMQDGDDGGTFAEEVVVDDLLPPDNFAMVEEGLYRGAALPCARSCVPDQLLQGAFPKRSTSHSWPSSA